MVWKIEAKVINNDSRTNTFEKGKMDLIYNKRHMPFTYAFKKTKSTN